jgi:hypothetical protein
MSDSVGTVRHGRRVTRPSMADGSTRVLTAHDLRSANELTIDLRLELTMAVPRTNFPNTSRSVARALGAVLVAVLWMGMPISPARADTVLSAPVQINFQARTTTTPAGYRGDFGQAYDTVRGYGWTTTAGVPLDLTANGVQRNVNANPLLDTFVRMQARSGSGTTTPGAWKVGVADGTYAVTVAVGDASFIDSRHVLNIEGVRVVDFTPTSATRFRTVTADVTVTGGFLDINATGGINTKIDYIQIAAKSATSPRVQVVTPANNATGVVLDAAVSVEFTANVDPLTVNASSFQLLDSNGTAVGGFYNVDGAYASATFQPSAPLAANRTYQVRVTSAMKDSNGNAFAPFASSFTTGTTTSTPPAGAAVSFSRSVFDFSDKTAATNPAYSTAGPAAMALGPNPASPKQLWVAFGTGEILVYNLDAAGKKVGSPIAVNNFRLNRLVSGLVFDPTSTDTNIKLWVSNAQFGCDLAVLGVACTNFTGAISTLTGTSTGSLTTTNIVTGLPRSVGNHMNNGLEFDSSGFLYVAQGAQNGYGSPDAIWGNRAEDPLTAAVLKIDVAGIAANRLAPYNVNTSSPNNYNRNATNARVTTYATGIRNPFAVVWHSNGKLYAPVNESSNGNTPADPAGGAPALTNLPAYADYFTQVVPGKYYGHPNPSRNEYRLNGGNPTAAVDPFEVPQYPQGTQPNANWRRPDLSLGVHRSPNSAEEFRSNVFGSALRGKILVTEYSQGKDLIAINLDANGVPVSKTVLATGFFNPLPLAVDNVSGRVYIGEYGNDPDGRGGQISLLSPNASTPTGPPADGSYKVNFQATSTTATPAGYRADTGAAFAPTTTGYGWENNATGAPMSISGNGRERNVAADKRLDTLMQMQAVAGAGITTPAKWEAVVPNGTYSVTVAVGDPSYTNSRHVLRLEGVVAVDFTPTSTTRSQTVTRTVSVTDGRLTVDPTGGTNTKIDYIDIVRR